MVLVIGILRANVEDFILGINLMEKHKLQFDISEEIGRVNFDIEETALNPRLFQEIEKVKQDAHIFYFQKNLPADKPLRRNFGFTTDGEFLYIHLKMMGLLKIGTGENDSMVGKVYAHKPYRINEKCKLLYFNGMLLCRSQSVSTKPLVIIDPITLDE